MRTRIINSLRLAAMSLCLAAAASQQAHGAVEFPATSELAQGHWVKINFKATGLYEITYDELRTMGFADPSKVTIYGRGGVLQPMQFTDAQGAQLYSSRLPQVAALHVDNKIIFFGQGPARIAQLTKNANRPAAQQFVLDSHNTYSSTGSYFLTDSRTDALVPEEATGTVNERLPDFTHSWLLDYHEQEVTNPMNKGREYFGEKFTSNSLSFPYSFPTARSGDQVSLTVRAVQHSGSASTLGLTIEGNGQAYSPTSLQMPAMNEKDYYANPLTMWYSTMIPGAEGSLTFNLTGTPNWAYMDYYIMALKSKTTFAEGQSSLMTYVGEYSPEKYCYIKIANAPKDLIVWDVESPADIRTLPVKFSGTTASVSNMRTAKSLGMMIAFSPSATHASIDSWSAVECANLHEIGSVEVPDLLIITLPAYREAAERIANLHEHMEGFKTAIVYSDDVVTEFSAGVNDPMAYRALAKMIYDRDDSSARKFKNILMLGPALRDMRGLEQTAKYGTLICNESFLGQNADESYTLNDWYGMMDDYMTYTPDSAAEYFARMPMQLGVGNIPCNTLEEANAYVDKLEQFYADDSLAYWLNEGNYCADGSDNNEHQNVMDTLHNDMVAITASSVVGNKLYNNLYGPKGTTAAFCRRLAEGSLHNWYLGHADAAGLNAEFWTQANEPMLSNKRLGFMTIAGCTITEFDCGVRGTGERLVFLPGKGLVGSLMTTRTCYAISNSVVSQWFQRSLMLNNPTDYSRLLSAPRTVGEAYAMGKSAYTTNSNKLAYVLLSDPALTLPIPTADVEVSINGDKGTGEAEVYPHSEVHLSGTLRDRSGNALDNFNGTVVAKVYDALRSRRTTPRTGAEVKHIKIDETPVAVTAFEVQNGRFSGSLLIPSQIANNGDTTAMVRFAAFDPSTRAAAAGARRLYVKEYNDEEAVETDFAPQVTAMYLNTPDYEEGMTVAPDFTLYADIEDDHGVMLYDIDGLSSLSLIIDGKTPRVDVNQHVTYIDGGRTCRVAYPMTGMRPGMHSLAIRATDAEGQHTERIMTVKVGNPALLGTLTTDDKPARESASFTLSVPEAGEGLQSTIVILDATGKEILTAAMQGTSFDWDLKDASGSRVAPGIYTAVARLAIPGMGQGASAPVNFIVF